MGYCVCWCTGSGIVGKTDHVLYPDIRQMPGHENISTTSGFYAFVTLDTLAKALERTNPEGRNAEKNWKDKKISEALYRL